MLDDLLKIKRLREDDAISALVKAQSFLGEQIEARDAKQREEADYKVWRVDEENRLYDEICGKNVALSDLEKLREQIGLLRQRELALHAEFLQMQESVKQARSALEEAKRRRVQAHKEVTKYEEYNQIIVEREKREAEAKEEAELEDFVSGKA